MKEFICHILSNQGTKEISKLIKEPLAFAVMLDNAKSAKLLRFKETSPPFYKEVLDYLDKIEEEFALCDSVSIDAYQCFQNDHESTTTMRKGSPTVFELFLCK